jgi:hypothetical protein
MAKADNNLFLSNLSGTIGDQMTIMNRGGSTIVSKAQKKRKKKSTVAQLQTQHNFKSATTYAKNILLDPDMEALYKAAAGPGQNAYNMAIRDATNPPEIISIIRTGDKIIVRAKDVFRVYRVKVAIYTADEVLQEEGYAMMERNNLDWTYQVKTALKTGTIKVKAEDLPGNETHSEISI